MTESTENAQKTRLKMFFSDYMHISQNSFCLTLGVSQTFVTNISGKGITKPKLDLIGKVFPELNISWLVTGEGDMIKKSIGKKPQPALEASRVYDVLEWTGKTIEEFCAYIMTPKLKRHLDSFFVETKGKYLSSHFLRRCLAEEDFPSYELSKDMFFDPIIETFPELSPLWVLSGEGPMFNEQLKDYAEDAHCSKIVNPDVEFASWLTKTRNEMDILLKINNERIDRIERVKEIIIYSQSVDNLDYKNKLLGEALDLLNNYK